MRYSGFYLYKNPQNKWAWECFPVELGLETWHFSYLPLRATDKLEYRRIRTTFENMNLPDMSIIIYCPYEVVIQNYR